MDDKFLPIGSVVLLEGVSKRIMITGFCVTPNDNIKKMFDYSGCLYPEGILTSDHVALFNHNQIKQEFALGYSDEEKKS